MRFRAALDTHALIWAVLDPDRLGPRARRIVAAAGRGELAISAPSIMELGLIIDIGKVDITQSWPTMESFR